MIADLRKPADKPGKKKIRSSFELNTNGLINFTLERQLSHRNPTFTRAHRAAEKT
jgi:hypothetical protein